MRTVLQIVLHKTATTYLQHFIFPNFDNVCYIGNKIDGNK
jgi:hypothetical protein